MFEVDTVDRIGFTRLCLEGVGSGSLLSKMKMK